MSLAIKTINGRFELSEKACSVVKSKNQEIFIPITFNSWDVNDFCFFLEKEELDVTPNVLKKFWRLSKFIDLPQDHMTILYDEILFSIGPDGIGADYSEEMLEDIFKKFKAKNLLWSVAKWASVNGLGRTKTFCQNYLSKRE